MRGPWKNGMLTGGLEKWDGKTQDGRQAITSQSGHMPCSTHSPLVNCAIPGSYICKMLLGVVPSPWFYLVLVGATSYPRGRSLSSVAYWGSYCARELLNAAPNTLA